MKKHLLFNQSFGTEASPNQTSETLTRENRIGLMSYLRRTLMLLFAVLVMSIANIGMAWGTSVVALDAGTYNMTSATASGSSKTFGMCNNIYYGRNGSGVTVNGGINCKNVFVAFKISSSSTISFSLKNTSGSTRTDTWDIKPISNADFVAIVSQYDNSGTSATYYSNEASTVSSITGELEKNSTGSTSVSATLPAGCYGFYNSTHSGDGNYITSIVVTAASSARTFKSGQTIFFKDASGNISGLSCLWKVSDSGKGNIYAYFWNDTEGAWSTYGDKVSGNWNEASAIYKFTVPGIGKEYTKVKFTRGTAATLETGSGWYGQQTADQTPEVGKNMYIQNTSAAVSSRYNGSWAKYAPDPALIGDFNNWDPDANVFGDYDGNVGVTYFTLGETSHTYGFKILQGETYYSFDNMGGGWTLTATRTSEQQLYDNNGNSNITSTTEVGEYAMKYDKSSHKFKALYYPDERLTKNTILYFDGRRETNWQAAPYHTKFYFKKYDSDTEISYLFSENPVESWVYYVTVPNNDKVGKVQLMRMNPSNHGEQWCYNNLVHVNTRSSSLQNCLTEEVGNESACSPWTPGWTTYCPPTTSETFTDNSTSVIAGTSGDGTSENPYLVPTTGTINVQASALKAVADGNMTINYDFKVDDSSEQAGEGNTYSKGSLSNNTTYTMSVDAYTVYNLDDSKNSTKHTPTALYYKALDVYTISYNKGSNGTGDNTTDEKIYGISKTLLGVTFTRTGYTQTAWNTDPSGTGGTSYSLSGSYTGNADVTLYPTWTANPISVTLAKGTNGTANRSATINYDATTYASFTAVSGNTGYRCTGYYDGETQVLNADGSFAADNVTGYITSGKWTKASNCTLTAHWTEQSYSITYKDGGNTEFSGTHADGHPTSHTYGSATALKKATKTGYAFAGWYTSSSCTGDAVTSLGATDYDDDIILYARWVELDLHQPGTYEKPEANDGYGRPLKNKTVSGSAHDYEVYMVTLQDSKGALYAGSKDTIPDGYAMFTTGAATTEIKGDGWVSFYAKSFEGSVGSLNNDEFSGSTKRIKNSHYAYINDASYVRLRVKGYDEFAFCGSLYNPDKYPDEIFTVKINGASQTLDSYTDQSIHVFRFELDDDKEYFIEVSGITKGSHGHKFRGFSLRLPDVTRYTVSATNTDGYGSVDVTSISNVRSGSTIYTSSNTLTVGGTTVTATENSSTAQYSYAFNNWTKSDGTSLPGTVTGAITVRANFTQTPVNYTLAWNANGGDAMSGTYTSGSTGYGTAIMAPNDPTRDGYTFTGWKSASNGSGDDYTGYMPAADVTYYAQWTKLYASGTYQFDGHLTVGTSPGMTVTTSEVSYDAFRIDNLFFSGSKIQFEGTDGTPQGDGDDYKGWKMKTNNSTIKFFVEYDSDVEVSIGGIGSSSSCKISYTDQSSVDHSNTSISAGNNPSYEVKAGTMVTITFTVDEGNKKSVTLKRIAISETAACTNPSASLSDGAYEVLGTALDLRTLWSSSNTTDGVTFTVTNAGGTSGTIAGDGYSFSASAAGSATIRAVQTSTGAYCDADETATITVTMPTYDVTLNANGGTINPGNNVTSYTYGVGATLPTDVTKSGYLFQGWYDNSGFSGDAVTTISSSATGNKTFYAKWYELAEKCETTNSTFADAVWIDKYVNGIRYDIEGTDGDQFEMGDGHYFHLFIGDLGTIKEIKLTITAVGTSSASTGIDYDFLESNEYAYYDFGDHTEDVTAERSLSTGTLSLRPTSGENNDFAFKTNGTTLTISNICIYYEPASYTLTWSTDGDVLTGDYTSGTVAYGTPITAPNTPTKTGYTFDAWSPTPAATMPAANTTYTATWTANTYDVDLTLTGSKATKESGTTGTNAATYGTNHTLTFAAVSGYTLPSDVTVYIGEDQASNGTEYSWSVSAGVGTLTIDGDYILDDITITVTAVEDVTTYSVIYTGTTPTTGSLPVDDTEYSGDGSETVTVEGDNSMTLTGYDFRGWHDGTTFFLEGQEFTMPASDVTLTAVWEPKSLAPVTLFSTDFSNAVWSGITNICAEKNAVDEEYNGITFHSYKNSDGGLPFVVDQSAGTMTWCNNNMSSNFWIAIPVTGVNGSITITVDNGSTATRFKYVVKQETSISGSGGSGTENSNSASDPATVTISNLNKSDYVVYLGRQGSGLTTITSITITTPGTDVHYDVAFDADGKPSDDMPSTVVGVPSGKLILAPSEIPTASGYTFDTWVTASGGSTEFDFAATTITSAKTIYAKWHTHTAITTQPEITIQAEIDEEFTLGSDMVAAGENLTYHWYSCDEDGTNRSSLADASSTKTKSETKTSAGTYYYICVVSGDYGDDVESNVVTVTVCTSIDPSLSYSATTIYAYGGKPREARPTLTDNTSGGAVTYSSSNTDVVTVNASTGVITAVGSGTATITATIAAVDDYCGATTTCNITVPALVQQTINLNSAWTTVPNMTFPGDPTSTLTKNANISATGYSIDESNNKSDLSSKIYGIPSTTSKDDNYYMSLKFNTPSYPVRVTSVVVPIQPITNTASAIVTVSDGTTTVTSTEETDIPDGAKKTCTFTITPTVFAAGSTITVKIFVYDQSGDKGFRLGSPILVNGSVLVDQRFTDANSTGLWSDPANWDGGSLPEIYHDVVIEKSVAVDIAHATAKSIVIYNNRSDKTGKLTIQPNKGLEVDGTIQKTTDGSTKTATGEADLVLESSSAGNASLIFNNSNGCAATVQMYSKAGIDGSTWNWQYVGTPFTGSIPLYNYYGSWMYKWDNGGWAVVKGGDELDPFAGYCLTQSEATTHVMGGTLVPTTSKSVTMAASTDMVLANSWTAPIYIGGFTAETFTSAPATIYLFNTGMAENGSEEYVSGDEAGTYVTVPINSAPYTGNELIAPMQGFFVTTNGGAEGTITMNYNDLVRPSGEHTDIVAGPMKAPKRIEERPEVMKIRAEGSVYNDRVVILSREDFSQGFDNGWDGKKMSFGNASPSVYVINEEGGYDAVSAIPEYEGTVVGFRAGTDSEYTIRFEYDGEEMLYLNDLQEQEATPIDSMRTYTFTAEAGDNEARFIISTTPIQKVITDIDPASGEQSAKVRKVIINDHIYIIRGGRMYSVDGALVK